MTAISYKNWNSMSDSALMAVIGSFVKHHRLGQNKSQTEVAKAAAISRSTLSLMERGEKVALSSLMQVLRVLNLLYIMEVFAVKSEISPIAYAKLKKQQRHRASKTNRVKEDPNEDLGW